LAHIAPRSDSTIARQTARLTPPQSEHRHTGSPSISQRDAKQRARPYQAACSRA
jgi:hypothetical protein